METVRRIMKLIRIWKHTKLVILNPLMADHQHRGYFSQRSFSRPFYGVNTSKTRHSLLSYQDTCFALVFQNYYSRLPEFSNNPFIPYVGNISTGITFLLSPVMAPIVKRFPKHQKYMIWAGWPLYYGHFGGEFVHTLPGLIMTQGVMYGGELSQC